MARKERKAERQSIVQVGAVDWLTVTTRDKDTYRAMLDIIGDRADASIPEKPQRLLGYEGWTREQFTYGERGVEAGETEYLVQASGKAADGFIDGMIRAGVRWGALSVSRLDVQLTVKAQDKRDRLSRIAQEYQQGKMGTFAGRGRPKVWAYCGDDGDTLYIGSTSSDKLIRVYDKPVIIGRYREVYERMELQLRRKPAEAAFRKIVSGKGGISRETIEGILAGHWGKFPTGIQKQLSVSKALSGAHPLRVEVVTDKETDGKVRWALGLEKSFQALADRGDNQGAIVRAMLHRVLVRSFADDPYTDPSEWVLVSPEGEIVKVLPFTQEWSMLGTGAMGARSGDSTGDGEA